MVDYYEHEELRVGSWRVRPRLNAISNGRSTIELEPKVIQVLLCLADRQGEVVSRRELFSTVWPDATVTDKVLSRAISLLRQALGDDPRNPRYVRTVAKVGYQLIAETGPVEPPAPTGTRPHTGRWAVAAALALGLVVGVLGSRAAAPWRTPAAGSPPVALTSLPGQERFPAISPDGTRVSFAWRPSGRDRWGIFLKRIGEDAHVRLTSEDVDAWRSDWSPEGRRLAWSQCRDGTLRIHTAVLDDSVPPRLIDAVERFALPIGRCDVAPATTPGISWSSDGRTLALPVPDGDSARMSIVALDLEDGSRRPLTAPQRGEWDSDPSFSPDGRTLAFTRRTGPDHAGLLVVSLDDGTERPLANAAGGIAGLDWRNDRQMLVARARSGRYDLWELDRNGAERWYPVRGDEIRQPAISTEAGRLVYESWSFDADVWLVTGSGEARPTAWSSSVWDGAPSFSPDGRHVAFVSVRDGAPQVWLADRPGGTVERLTRLDDVSIRLVRWSADGRRIAFVARGVDRNALWVIDVARRDVRVVFRTSDPIAAPSFADDDRELWFGRSIDGRWSVWSLPSSGGDRPRLRIPDAFVAVPAPGEPGVAYYTRFAGEGLWRIDHSHPGGRPERIIAELAEHDWANWSATDRGIVYPVRGPEQDVRLTRYDPASGSTETIASLPWPPVAGHAGIAVSPRGALLVTRVERASSDLVVANLPR